jgi:murein DD-endopeptidase MepM/ murein hydrolase activator NlpD
VGDIFHQQGISPGELQKLLEDRDNAKALRNIHPGDEFAFARAADGSVSSVRFDRDEHTRVIETFTKDGIRESVQNREIERRTHVAHGVVEHSLFDAGEQAGMSDSMVLKLADAFGYDIDFAQDLRQGDSFTVIYDDVYCEGEHLHTGDIIAATFINHGKRFSAFRYTDGSGNTMYFSEDGRPLRKAFLRTPVEFSRISSLFSAARQHPILGTMRAHRGVDYAAPTGTPIHAAGEGKVMFHGWQNGYGNVVILQHGGRYSTLYGHMSRFAGIRDGQHVSQGQTIGFVGMTGMATGPHLHYEFRIDGVHRDPLTVTLPKAEPLPATELARFQRQSQPLLAKLKTLESTQLALAK